MRTVEARVATSDGRSWQVFSDPVDGWITRITPGDGKGIRSFGYNSAGRATGIRNANNELIYGFTYDLDADNEPTILRLETGTIVGSSRDEIAKPENPIAPPLPCVPCRHTENGWVPGRNGSTTTELSAGAAWGLLQLACRIERVAEGGLQ